MQLMLITQHLPLDTDVLPEPVVVATITTDTRIVGNAKTEKILEQLAAKLGLLQFTLQATDPLQTPGYQLPLFTHRC